MAVTTTTSGNNKNGISWSDEIGFLPLFLTLILPILIGVIVLIKCVYNHCCLRKTSTSKSYTVKPTLKSWKGTSEEADGDVHDQREVETEGNHIQSNSCGSATNSIVNHNNAANDRVNPIQDAEAPVPPRRTGSSEWRRVNPPPQAQVQQNSTNDNQVNFSGDSQDSRGYTRISVREPLSNIRNQAVRRNVDSYYATVSDNSEEMYAAIEDNSDGNYMRIPGDEASARHWQERREANSPLPPVPPISPVLLTSSEVIPPPTASSSSSDPLPTIQPPIYAQVTKTKKSKAPIPPTPTLSNSLPSSSHTPVPLPLPPEPSNDKPPPAPSKKQRSHHHTSAILDAPDIPPSRRWSKADISYSEFEIVREPPNFSLTKSSITTTTELIDEDNYNLISDVRTRTNSRPSRNSDNTSSISTTSRTLPHRSSSSSKDHPYSELKKPITSNSNENHVKNHGYSEIKKRNSLAEDSDPHHPYTEIKKRRSTSRSPTGYYQEIGDSKPMTKKRDNVYQKIRRKGGGGVGDESDDDDEDEEDQFYETVKTKPSISSSQHGTSAGGGLPENTNPSALKHGYETIKPKVKDGQPTTSSNLQPPSSPAVIESDEDGSSLYEQVKYPPYERLKESRDTLQEEDDEAGNFNLYEDIGYSRITKSNTTKSSQNHGAVASTSSLAQVQPPLTSPVDLDNLYARVDISKKKRKTQKIDTEFF